jgi:hypothetical protein
MFSQRSIKKKVGATINPTVIGTPMKYATRNPPIISPSVIGFEFDVFSPFNPFSLFGEEFPCNCRCPILKMYLRPATPVAVKTLGVNGKRVSKEFIINFNTNRK